MTATDFRNDLQGLWPFVLLACQSISRLAARNYSIEDPVL